MNILKMLETAGVHPLMLPEALEVLETARQRARGLTWAKWKVRLFKAGKIAAAMEWGDERYLGKGDPNWDIAPMLNITGHGDNVPWPDGRPAPGAWLNADPESEEFRQAVASNYWLPGTHPRSKESRKAWYRRNAGEYRAWLLGAAVDPTKLVHKWESDGVSARRHNGAWQLVATVPFFGPIKLKIRIGYEIDNVLRDDGTQLWYPIPGHALQAPVTWSVLPKLK